MKSSSDFAKIIKNSVHIRLPCAGIHPVLPVRPISSRIVVVIIPIRPVAGRIGRIVIAVEEAVGFCLPQCLLVVLFAGAFPVIERPDIAVSSVREVAVSVSGTPAVVCTVGLSRIPGHTLTGLTVRIVGIIRIVRTVPAHSHGKDLLDK